MMEDYKFQVTDVHFQITSNRVSLVEKKHQVSDINMVLLTTVLLVLVLLHDLVLVLFVLHGVIISIRPPLHPTFTITITLSR